MCNSICWALTCKGLEFRELGVKDPQIADSRKCPTHLYLKVAQQLHSLCLNVIWQTRFTESIYTLVICFCKY